MKKNIALLLVTLLVTILLAFAGCKGYNDKSSNEDKPSPEQITVQHARDVNSDGWTLASYIHRNIAGMHYVVAVTPSGGICVTNVTKDSLIVNSYKSYRMDTLPAGGGY